MNLNSRLWLMLEDEDLLTQSFKERDNLKKRKEQLHYKEELYTLGLESLLETDEEPIEKD